MSFVHLHCHSDGSFLDGMAKPEEYVERAVKLGQPALAITDHGNLCVAPEHYFLCRAAGIEPILGSEFYFVPDSDAYRASKGKKDESDGARYHITVLAKGERGYRALSELSTESFRNFYYKPLLDRKTLTAFDMRDLVVLSGCANSLLSKVVLSHDNVEDWDGEMMWWTQNIPNFYIELQEHGTEFDARLNKGLLKLAKRYKIPWAITNDPHYVLPDDCHHHDVLLALQTGSNLDDPDRLRFDGSGYHLRSEKQMMNAWRNYRPEVVKIGIKNTVRIAEQCKTTIKEWEKRTWHIPQVPGIKDGFKELKKLARRGMKTIFSKGTPLILLSEYRDRYERELDAINEAGIADCLLITRDCIRWAKRKGIPVGPGRGSVCGSLVCYVIGIHNVDPVRYNLMFERFLNLARPSMPDIDTDFGQYRREELFKYVIDRYGDDNIIHVAAFQTMKIRRAFQGIAKSHGLAWKETVAISKTLDDESDLPAEIAQRYPELTEQLERLSGIRAGVSTHPAGVIIAAPKHKIKSAVPQMYLPSSKKWVAQYDLSAIDKLGYLKQDFLGLRTLETITDTVQLLREYRGIEVDPNLWVPDEEPDDDKVYEMLNDGDTAGVFQMEGGANTRGIQQIGCEKFEDVVSCTALFRTGPILAKFPDQFVENKSKKKLKHDHPVLESVLGNTMGVILYQEQVMEIGRLLAGFSWAQVDDLKDAVKKKKSKLMTELRRPFLKGCAKNGVPDEVVRKVWKNIQGYAGYAFNRNHAVAYSMISYQTARLKYLYPLEFFTALIRTVGDKEKRTRYLRGIMRRGYKIQPPDINVSGSEAIPTYDPEGIMFGLQDLTGLGSRKISRLLTGRPYRNVEQVAAMTDKGAYKVLCDSGSLRALGIKGSSIRASQLMGWNFADRMAKKRDVWEDLLVEPDSTDGPVQIIGELIRVTEGKTKGGKPFQTWVVRWDPVTEWTIKLWLEAKAYWGIPVGRFVRIQGTWQQEWENVTVNYRGNSVYVWDRKWERAERWLSSNENARSK